MGEALNSRGDENNIDIPEKYILECTKIIAKTYSWTCTYDRGEHSNLASCKC